MSYSKFILEALKSATTRPTKDQMQFAYIVCYCGFNLTIEESIKEATN